MPFRAGRPTLVSWARPRSKSHRQPEYNRAGIHRIIASLIGEFRDVHVWRSRPFDRPAFATDFTSTRTLFVRSNFVHGLLATAKPGPTRVFGAEGSNRSGSFTWAGKQEKLRSMQLCFFLTSHFIELIRNWPFGCAITTDLQNKALNEVFDPVTQRTLANF